MASCRESVTPIFDEVDRRWCKAEDQHEEDQHAEDGPGTAAPSMLSFTTTPPTSAREPRRAHATPAPDGSSPTVLSLITAARRDAGPRHALRR